MISTRRTGEKQGKRKPSTRPRPNRDSKDSLEQEKKKPGWRKIKKWNPNGMLGGKVLTGLRVKAKKSQESSQRFDALSG